MNFSQKLGLFILIIISVAYVYFSFFNKDFQMPEFNLQKNNQIIDEPDEEFNALETQQPDNTQAQEKVKPKSPVSVKIFICDKSGNICSVNRTCDPNIEKSCFAYAIKELMKAPSSWEKSKGFNSEIPQGTKILSIRESADSIMIDLSSNFETGGGAESTYIRVKQVIKTANANTSTPVYLYLNGKQANVIGGEGIMLKQPLNERSLDE
mgnify:CR=1 FL=1